ncbi:hypothetical protein L218DRAFT_434690 [Marasmius fiardii PR-910]|nr:hypothetical protein L218DRAFT_434690 [Marasmius fiardii PR-910]
MTEDDPEQSKSVSWEYYYGYITMGPSGHGLADADSTNFIFNYSALFHSYSDFSWYLQ